jgi:midasin (ATPase involved in ribosome maturation)
MSNVIETGYSVTPQQAYNVIQHAIKCRKVPMIWGPPGVAKSDIVHELAKNLKRKVIDIRLSLWEPTDLKGIPYFDMVEKTMKWCPSEELPSLFDDTSLIFLDELSSAPPSTQVAAYQLILNRRIGSYVLPHGVDMIAAGNRVTDRSVSYAMSAALANRFAPHITIRADFESWLDWAIKNKINSRIISYLENNKQDLYTFDPNIDQIAFATGRTWQLFNDLLTDDIDDSILRTIAIGTVGEAIGVKFMMYYDLTANMPRPIDVLNGVIKTWDEKNSSKKYALTISLLHEVRELRINQKSTKEHVENLMWFFMTNYEPELVVMASKMMTKYGISCYTELKGTSAGDEWVRRYADILVAATTLK